LIVYQGTTEQFSKDVLNNRVADLMAAAFKSSFGHKPSNSEYNSWNNSCQHLKNLVSIAGLTNNMVCLEYEVPYNTGRIDCMFFGRGIDKKAYTVLMELKQWSQVEELDDEENFVETFVGGNIRKVPHPSQQVEGYHNHLINFVQVFELDENYNLFSCAYCHNYSKQPGIGLFADRYNKLIYEFPVYSKNDVQKLANKLKLLLSQGDGFEIFNRFMQSPIKPSKKLLENASKIVDQNKAVFSLLNEQLVAKNVIMSKVRKAEKTKQKSVIIVHGGPGTGKTVIALNILAELAGRGKSVFYGCKSKPFREALTHIVGKKSRILFSNLGRFIPSKVKANDLDVVLVDEAHRIENKSNSQYTKKQDRTEMPQTEQLIRCAKTAVFFIDDKQNVRSQEVGSSQLIEKYASQYDASFERVQLVTQFRCNGSDGYLDWLEYVLGYSKKLRKLTTSDNFVFKIFDSPDVLYKFIKSKELKKPNSARLVAGYCWPWSDPNPDGSLVKDVVIEKFAMPWEAKDGKGMKVLKGIPKWYQWAYKTEGVEQIGCIYTAQGFEFDYIGVIVGNDLQYDSLSNSLVGNIEGNRDPTLKRAKADFDKYVKNIYRVLMSRGMKGCCVYFVDKKVEAFFKNHMDSDIDFPILLPEDDVQREIEEMLRSIEISIDDDLKYTEYLPLYSFSAACGYFGDGEPAEVDGWIKVGDLRKINRNMFVVRACGKSMEPVIPADSFCIFRAPVVGSRNNKIVLVQHRNFYDSDHGGAYSIKKYSSEKRFDPDGNWQHEEINLHPINSDYTPISIPESESESFTVIAEFIGLISANKSMK
jgi:DUF2075 family protein/phage repressor protein C with HTH and peptisase S24 domain